jgi:hemerythrin
MTMAMRWTDALAVGHLAIDAQHRELFARLDLLLTAMIKGDPAEVGRLFDFLGGYVVEHFGMEEQLMRESGYSALERHQAIHRGFIEEYQGMRQSYQRSGGGAALGFRLQRWMGDWLKGHIAGTDQALASFLAQRAA